MQCLPSNMAANKGQFCRKKKKREKIGFLFTNECLQCKIPWTVHVINEKVLKTLRTKKN